MKLMADFELNECAVKLHQEFDGTLSVSLVNCSAEGQETLTIHHVARDLVRFLQGRPCDEFEFDYEPVKRQRRKLRIIDGGVH